MSFLGRTRELKALHEAWAAARSGFVPIRQVLNESAAFAREPEFLLHWCWRKELHRDFKRALAEAKLPERPDDEAANRFLVKARRQRANHE